MLSSHLLVGAMWIYSEIADKLSMLMYFHIAELKFSMFKNKEWDSIFVQF